jgi:hypothetical protein
MRNLILAGLLAIVAATSAEAGPFRHRRAWRNESNCGCSAQATWSAAACSTCAGCQQQAAVTMPVPNTSSYPQTGNPNQPQFVEPHPH